MTKTKLLALLPASRAAASSIKNAVKRKAKKDGNNGVDIRTFFAAK